MPLDDNCPSMNQMILAKREETEKMILNEHKRILLKTNAARQNLIAERTKIKIMQEESNILNHKSMLLSSEIEQLRSNTESIKENLIDLECKTDEIKMKQDQANMVKEKEIKTLKIFYDKLMSWRNINLQFWNKEMKNENLTELEKSKETVLVKKSNLEKQIKLMKEKNTVTNITKLTEECMILKKRNAAIQKRLAKRLEHLELQLEQTKSVLKTVNSDKL